MIWVDYIIMGIIAVSAVVGLVRGLIREVVSLAIWAAAIVVGWMFYRPVADMLVPWLSTPSLRLGAAFLLLVIGVLLIGAIVGYLLAVLVERTGLTGTDRLFGLVFGTARGVVIVALIVFLAALTPLSEDPWWKQSQLISHFQRLGAWLADQLPPEWTAKVKSL